ncbi:DNA-binding protein [Fructilactobacillus fructivorans]|nr:DNA-binding protein [Fructilactobacillus fructivorans]KRN43504.1 DNA-binding protein [Fructilactobacillus fructivorans]
MNAMDIKKNNRINALYDFYGELLTKKQAEYIQEYYADDFSLGEISENFDISRQAVYDNIKRTEQILEDYESKMHLYQLFVLRNQQTDEIRDYVRKNYPNDTELNELVDHLEITEEN